jgi:2-keto-4-pentenoate hydratase/2-oxohepta-3-ene-1,7-dioic acid hydratase in catechol pathway
MKLANLRGRATIVTSAGGVDVEKASQGRFAADPQGLFDDWDECLEWAAGARLDPTVGVVDAELGPPVPRPRQVFGIGLNYRAHAEEASLPIPDSPATFTKFPTCLTGPSADVELPSAMVDWEVELVVVIGRLARRVPAEAAWQHVAGLMVGQDLSERVVQWAAGAQFSLGKSFPGFGPTGPWLVTPDEIANPDDLELGCSIDGETVQKARTSDMVFPVPRLIAELSAVLPLLPGDIIFTGTPAGVGASRQPPRFLKPGEVLTSYVEGVGTIRNRLVASGA